MLFDAAPQDAFVSGTGDAIENHAANPNRRIEHAAARNDGRHGSRGFGAVDDQQDGEPQQFGQFGRTGFAMGVDAVIDAAIAFDDRQITILAMGGVGPPDALRGNQKGIQIVTGSFAGGQG